MEMQNASFTTLTIIYVVIEIFILMGVTERDHLMRKFRSVTPTWITDHDLNAVVRVAINKVGNIFNMCRLIENIATNNNVESTQIQVPLGYFDWMRNRFRTNQTPIQRHSQTYHVVRVRLVEIAPLLWFFFCKCLSGKMILYM